MRWLCLGSALWLASGCTPAPVLRDDPLIGTLYTGQGEPITRSELLQRLLEADIVYIGETHDNLQHQAIQLDLLKQLLEAGARPVLGSEFFSREDTSVLALHLKPQAHGAGRDWRPSLREALGWGGDARDDDWAHYEPLLSLAREAGLSVFGAELPDALRRRLSRVEPDALHPVERLLLPALGADDPEYRDAMFEAFTAAHCGWRNENLLQRLYTTWRLRNEAMAESVIAAASGTDDRPVLLITGAGHVQGNRGIYERVAALRPDLRQFNLGLRQVGIQAQPLAEYLSSDPQARLPDHDVIWLTQRSSYEDPCERFRKQLHKPPGGE